MRVFNRRRLLEEQSGQLRCPYCGNTRFTESFGNILLVLDPEKSVLARKTNKNEKGIYALTIETY